MSIPAIGAAGFTPFVPPSISTTAPAELAGLDGAATTPAVGGAGGADFTSLLSQGLENLQGLHTQAESLSLQAATGDLDAMHDYTIKATEASVATQLTTAVRNKALEAFQEIMRMSV